MFVGAVEVATPCTFSACGALYTLSLYAQPCYHHTEGAVSLVCDLVPSLAPGEIENARLPKRCAVRAPGARGVIQKVFSFVHQCPDTIYYTHVKVLVKYQLSIHAGGSLVKWVVTGQAWHWIAEQDIAHEAGVQAFQVAIFPIMDWAEPE